MSDLYWLTGEQMARLTPHFPKSHGATRYDRSPTVFLSAIALAATVLLWL